MSDPLNVLILVAVNDDTARNRILTYLPRRRGTAAEGLIDCAVRVEQKPLEAVNARLKNYYARHDLSAAVVVSDQLVEAGEPTLFTSNLLGQFEKKLYATIALVPRPERILDIDRTLALDCSSDDFRAALKLCLERLAYLAVPDRRESAEPIDIRLIENETELLEYFQLRHRVYTPMSYLETLVEQVPSKMEIDWFDTRSVHIGAFLQSDGLKSLVGTARLITTEPVNEHHAAMARQLASRDSVLERLVNEGAIPTLLPVFQSQDLEDHFLRAMKERLLVGELSRVIVAPDCRGRGLSQQLVETTINLARQMNVFELFLECLPVHTKIYRKRGFKTMTRARGKVYSVNKTMCVMHLPLQEQVAEPVPTGPATSGRPALAGPHDLEASRLKTPSPPV